MKWSEEISLGGKAKKLNRYEGSMDGGLAGEEVEGGVESMVAGQVE